MSSEPTVVILLDDDSSVYRPGGKISGQYWIESLDADQVKAVEVSILWYTEGKGDEDMAVHAFWRRNADDALPFDPSRPERFAAELPNSPLSYEGQILKLRWCVRVRAFLHRGKDFVGERMFQLGEVPPSRIHSPPPSP
jgi:hypothetical protein